MARGGKRSSGPAWDPGPEEAVVEATDRQSPKNPLEGTQSEITRPDLHVPMGFDTDPKTIVDPRLREEIHAALRRRSASAAQAKIEAQEDTPAASPAYPLALDEFAQRRTGDDPSDELDGIPEEPLSLRRTIRELPAQSRLIEEPSLPRLTIPARPANEDDGLISPLRPRRLGPEPGPLAVPHDFASALGVPDVSKPDPDRTQETPDPPSMPEAESFPDVRIEDVKGPKLGAAAALKDEAPVPRLAPPERTGDLEEIQSLKRTTEIAAKLIPILIAVFVVVGTLVVGVSMFTGAVQRSPHVTLRFLAVGTTESANVEPLPSDPPTHIEIETNPKGVMVVFDRRIVGKTPCAIELPIRLKDQVGVELTSPYFITWIGEIEKQETGDFHLRADLVEQR